ncbi:MAG: UDP-N-acetylglucosamine 4,6-dehydratase (inverting) [Candidatus Eremiobacteraeota bacterium]|nr:UDP-N-acetylglucosamine 4,6-dehydratase (inverting) [Candidatus Eremiobacteraeota bacterium]
MLDDKVILLTGGTGSFGQKFVEMALKRHNPMVIRVYSRDELKQWEMMKLYGNESQVRFFIGDVRDKDRLDRAMDGVDMVIHAAALKQVPFCEYNPIEAVKTNILGAQNIIECAIDHNIPKVAAISTDKAVSPVNLYGATKMCMEKLLIAANAYVGGKRQTRMSCIRYGNVVGSRGSVIPLFLEQKNTGKITITHKEMTRFWITLEQGVEFVIKSVSIMHGGEVFIPKVPSMRIMDLAEAIAPDCEIDFVGIRPGEKIHESLLTADEARHSLVFDDCFIIEPEHTWWNRDKITGGKELPEGFCYESDKNDWWLSKDELQKMISE